MTEVILPFFPPTVNHYWKTRRAGKNGIIKYISAEGKRFREQVFKEVMRQRVNKGFEGRLSVIVKLYPPDKRKRDLDNFNKGLLDALTVAGVWEDDSQIDRLVIERCEIVSGGEAVIHIEEMQ